MKTNVCVLVFVIAIGAPVGVAQQTTPPGRGGAPASPPVPSLSQRPPGTGLGTIRGGAADNNIWFGWNVGIPTAAFRQMTFSDALAKADTLGVTGVEASNLQRVSFEIPKNLDYNLQPGERAGIVRRLRELNQRILAYRVDKIGADEATQRKVFEFAKAINAPMLITTASPASLASLDKRPRNSPSM